MKRFLTAFPLIFGVLLLPFNSARSQCHSQYNRGSIIGDSSCIHADDQIIHTYRYVFPASTDTGDVIQARWSVYGALDVVEEEYDFIRVRSTDTGEASLNFSYRLRSDQEKSCVRSGCVSYSYYANKHIYKIYNSSFMPVIEGNPLVTDGEKSTFWVSGLLPNASITWTAPEYMEMVKRSSNSEYVTYEIHSLPQAGDSLQVRMNLVCNAGLIGKMALTVGTEEPEIAESEALSCVPVMQDSIILSVKEPRSDYSYRWECWNENWTIRPMEEGTQAALNFTGEERQGTVVLYATNGFDTAYRPYKVVRCDKTCSYDTTQGIDLSLAKCLRPGDTAVFRIKADPDAVSYTWEFGGGWMPETYTVSNPYDTVVRVVVGDAWGWVRVTGENCSGEWHMETEDSIPVVTYEARLAHYDGCVNIGLPDTLHLQVENIQEGNAYQWMLPENWMIVGCDTCGEIEVAVQEMSAVMRTYGVMGNLACPDFVSRDTVFVKGADTVVIILDDEYTYFATPRELSYLDEESFDFLWFKGYLHSDNIVDIYVLTDQYLFDGESPILAYRYNDGCWSTTEEIVEWTEDMEITSFATKRETSKEVSDVEQTISMIPNPTTNQTLLRWETDIERIEIISESGQRIRTFNVSGLQQKIVDMSHMSAGVYIVRFLDGNVVVAMKKLVKK